MSYSDSNPERRNLTVLSLAVIVYYLAEGQFMDGEIKLMFINSRFNNPDILVIFVWVMICWFWFRYFITNKNNHGILLESDQVPVDMNNWITRSYRIYKSQPVDRLSAPVSIYTNYKNNWCINMGEVLGGGFDEIDLSGLHGYFVRILYMLKITLKHKATTDYYTPYILLFAALSIGILSP